MLRWLVPPLALSAVVAAAAAAPASPASPSSASSSLRKRDDGSRAVFAHVVQGDFQNYGEDDYSADFAMGKEAGIAAFALNVGGDDTDAAQLVKAFSAASTAGMKLFYSFDLGCCSAKLTSDTILSNYLTKDLAGSDAYYLVDGKALVSTFSGHVAGTFLDGAGSLENAMSGWTTLLNKAKETIGKEISFAPGWFDSTLAAKQTYGGGLLSWAAWGDKGRTDSMSTTSDEAYLAACSSAGLYYIAPVAAFFFVHVASDNNYVLNSNDFLLPNHYSDVINLDPGPRFIELLSWNDLGESHYLGVVRQNAGVPSTATGYVDTSRDHSPMLWVSAYYNVWFTNGSPPTITSEAVVWYHRKHPASASASSDSIDKPQYAETLDDQIYAIVFVPPGSKATKLVMTTGGSATDAQDVKEGVNLVSVAFVAGGTGISLQDDSGSEVLSGTGVDIEGSPSTYDFNFLTYILPEGATASTFLDIGSSTSTNASTSIGTSSAGSSKSATGGAAGTATRSSSAGSSRSATGLSEAAGATASSPGGGTASSTSGDSASSSSTSYTIPLVAGALAIFATGVGVYLYMTHGRAAEKARAPPDDDERKSCGREESGSSGGSDGGSDSDASTASSGSSRSSRRG